MCKKQKKNVASFLLFQLDQGELGLPSREYYLTGNVANPVLAAYSEFIRGTAMALGGRQDVVDDDVSALIQFETQLAAILTPTEERRNFTAMYHKVSVAQLDKLSGSIPWSRFLAAVLGRPLNATDEHVVLYASEYFNLLAGLIEDSDPR